MNNSTALLVIDMQAGLVHGAYREKETLQIVSDLIERARTASVPVIYIQHDDTPPDNLLIPNTPGWQIHSQITPQPGEAIFEKTTSDAFFKTPLQDELIRQGIKHLVICGMQTEFCVNATSRRAVELGYLVTVVTDGHTTFDGQVPAHQMIAQENNELKALSPGTVTLKNGHDIDFNFYVSN
jgi:nicotinamidase-related amidase